MQLTFNFDCRQAEGDVTLSPVVLNPVVQN